MVSYLIQKSPLLDPILSNINPFHTLISCLFKIYFNIILSLALSLPSGLLHSGFPTKILYVFLIFLILRPSHPPYAITLSVPDEK